MIYHAILFGEILSGASLSAFLPRVYKWTRDKNARVYFHPSEGWTLTNGAAIDKDPKLITDRLRRGFLRSGLSEEETSYITPVQKSNGTTVYKVPLMSVVKTRKRGGKLLKK